MLALAGCPLITIALAAVAQALVHFRRQGPDDFAPPPRFPAPRPPFADSPPHFPGPGSPFPGGAQPPFSPPKGFPGGGRFPVFAANGNDDDDKSSKSKDSDDKDDESKKESSSDDDDSKSSDDDDKSSDSSDDDDSKSSSDSKKSSSSSSSSSSGKSSSGKSKGSGDDDDDSSSSKKGSSSGSKGSSSKDDKSSSSTTRKDGPTQSNDGGPVIPALPADGGKDDGGTKTTASRTSSDTVTAPTQTRPQTSKSRASTSSSSTSLTNSGSELELSSPTSLSSGPPPRPRTFPLAAAGVIGAVSSFLVVSAIIWGLWLGLRRRRKRRSPGRDVKVPPPSDASPRILTLPSFPSMTVTDSTRQSEGAVPFWLRAADLDVPYQRPLYAFARAHESSAQSDSVSSVTVRPGANRV